MVARSKICAQPKRLLKFFNSAGRRRRHTVDAKATFSALGIVFVLGLKPRDDFSSSYSTDLHPQPHPGGKAEPRIDGRPTI
ncbi:hypothetical protein CSAL01_02576 [Colletotrichum salicis]|uniref:Uncharacterized protein n=1 Tax=Colletotrichum salicis TaxID=1209931 RepID=A0A135V3Z4_9PEZI|nr:hypothetical protein CSAL01_02576 [Colletotrichum salicis]